MRRVGVLVLVAVPACLLPTLDGLGGSVVVDAATPPDAATTDAIASDAANDAPSGPYCTTLSPKPTLCADFDDGDLPAGFDSVVQFGLGGAALNGAPPGSPARSLFVSTPALSGSDNTSAYLRKTLPTKVASLRIEFDYRQELWDATEHAVVVVNFGGPETILLFVRQGYTRIAEDTKLADGGTGYGGGTINQPFVLGTWAHVRYTFTIGATSSSVSLNVDGQSIGSYPLVAHKYPSPPRVDIGLNFAAAPTTGWSARLDDVVVDAK